MNINTKLVLLLTLTVGAVMFTGSYVSLHLREAALEAALRDELRAHAVTLQIVLEEKYKAGRLEETRVLAERLLENSKIYAVLLFDEKGVPNFVSIPNPEGMVLDPPELQDALRSGEAREFVRSIGASGDRYASAILPMKFEGRVVGAVELVKPLSLIKADIFRARMNWAATTLLLLALIFLVVFLITKRNISRPIEDLLEGAAALGTGDFGHRVRVGTAGDEFAQLAAEFNRMAHGLAEQKAQTEREIESRLELEKQLRHGERLATVGHLAAGVAHELGAPLNVIDARAEQLQEKKDIPPAKQEQNLRIIREQTARISKMIRQLLNLARPYDLRPARTDLTEVVLKALDQFESEASRQGVRIVRGEMGAVRTKADRDYLSHAFANLIQNSIQAMADGGTLTVEMSRNGSSATVCFRDTGPGIAPENLERIFDPFFTTKDIGKGTGLGLAVASRIVEEHGGRIEAHNAEEGGAEFRIQLPIV